MSDLRFEVGDKVMRVDWSYIGVPVPPIQHPDGFVIEPGKIYVVSHCWLSSCCGWYCHFVGMGEPFTAPGACGPSGWLCRHFRKIEEIKLIASALNTMTPIKNLPPNRLVCLIAEVPHMLLKLAPAGLLARSGAGDLVVHDEGQYLTARCSKEEFERVTG